MKKEKKFYELWWFWVIIVVFILCIFGWNPFDNNDNKTLNKNVNGDGYDWEGYVQEGLEEEGFEVIDVLVMNVTSSSAMPLYFNDRDKFICNDPSGYCVFDKRTINVEMKSLGNRAEQIQQVIFNSILIGNIYGFWIDIDSPTDTCTYVIKMDDWSSCLNDKTYTCYLDKFVTEDSLLLCE